jgi:DNA-directed RNA polymerase subunit H (RpoH/RPB5)
MFQNSNENWNSKRKVHKILKMESTNTNTRIIPSVPSVPSSQRPSSLKILMEEMDMDDFRLVDRYFKIHRTLVEMLEVRGYIVPDEEKKATQNLHDFMRYLKLKKETEFQDKLRDIILELLDQKYITDPRSSWSRFEKEKLSLFSYSMDRKDISSEMNKCFKTTSKLTRDLDDVLDEKLKDWNDGRTVEFLNQIYESSKTGEKILAYYHYNSESEKKENKKKINDVILDILNIQKASDLKDILFISETKLNTQMVDDLKRYTEKMRITIFLGDYMLFNITKHFLVPQHHLMTPEEMKEFLKDKEKGFVYKLPKIYDTDPISRFYGAKAGQIFKIIRENLSDDSMIRFSEFYRYVAQEIKK